MSEKMSPHELESLMIACIESSDDCRQPLRIESAVGDDLDALAAYVEEMRIHAMLQWRFKEQRTAAVLSELLPKESPSSFGTSPLGHSVKDAFPIAAEDPIVTEASSSSCLPFKLNAPPIYLTSGWPAAYLIATVIFAVGALVGTFTHVSQPVGIVQQASNSVARSTVANLLPEATFVGRITGMVGCMWEDGSKRPISRYVAMGQKYALASGLMEITYDTGASIILQGPVTYEVESKNGGFLSLGKMTGKVQVPTAKGFAVRTPTAIVTDLGTEFGVEVKDDGNTVSHVFQGAIELRQLGDHANASMSLRLTKNESAEVVCQDGNAVTVRRTTSDPASFVRSEQMANRLKVQRSSHVRSPRALWPILDKTLVAWVSLDNLEQQGVGVVSIVQMPEFDGIVFGEIASGRWMAGSHMLTRSVKDQLAYPIETAGQNTFLQIAAVYEGTTVTLYRNGVEYARHDTGMTQSYSKDAVILIGKRHQQDGPSQPPTLVGAVEEVRFFNVALRPEAIAALRPNEPSSIVSIGCWNFEDGTARDSAGHFSMGELHGNARIDQGKLILDGQDSYLVVPSTSIDEK